jgi:ribonuclease E
MAIEPKAARKRAIKKVSAKKTPGKKDSGAEVRQESASTVLTPIISPEVAPVKTVAKRIKREIVAVPQLDSSENSGAVRVARAMSPVPVPLFQAAQIHEPLAAPSSPRVAKKATTQRGERKSVIDGGSKTEEVSTSDSASALTLSKAEDSEGSEIDDAALERRRRRRGGRGRRRSVRDNSDEASSDLRDSDSDEDLDAGSLEESDSGVSDSDGEDSSDVATHRRRRRRRSQTDGIAAGETVDEDGVPVVVKVREPRARADQSTRTERPPRSTSSTRDTRDKYDRRSNRKDREPRDFVRRRGTIITESEFLARRESVDREMLVRQTGDRTQIAVIEDKIMVEHYVNRNSNISYVGNVYLGRVQNVLPSMEAAFVDIGKGRNAVLYAGEVNWDSAGLADGHPRKIEHVLKTGQPVLVQVTKDPIGQKGARLTSQISLPGRYLVYVPGGEMSGISRRLPEQERSRLKTILKNLIPEEAGVIVRTASEGASEEELERDVIRLKAQWEDIETKAQATGTAAPSLLYSEPDLTVRVIRDIFNEDFRKLIVQGDQAWDDINNYLGHIAPELTVKIEKWTGLRELFTEYRVEEQLAKAFDRKVYLPSGGSLVIDRTEAMIVIDVNTGKFIGKGGNLEETVTKNNLEAAEEIARQLRLRDMGGIIVIDFIDMSLESNRDQVLRRLVECLGRDRTKHQVAEVTSLGLVQMTRKRVGQGLIEAFSTTCESCGGRGIHIHQEPVRKVSLEKDMEQRYVHQVAEESTSTDSTSAEETAEDLEAISAEISEGGPVTPISTEVSEIPTPAPANSGGRPSGRRRRRAVSTGIITHA